MEINSINTPLINKETMNFFNISLSKESITIKETSKKKSFDNKTCLEIITQAMKDGKTIYYKKKPQKVREKSSSTLKKVKAVVSSKMEKQEAKQITNKRNLNKIIEQLMTPFLEDHKEELNKINQIDEQDKPKDIENKKIFTKQGFSEKQIQFISTIELYAAYILQDFPLEALNPNAQSVLCYFNANFEKKAKEDRTSIFNFFIKSLWRGLGINSPRNRSTNQIKKDFFLISTFLNDLRHRYGEHLVALKVSPNLERRKPKDQLETPIDVSSYFYFNHEYLAQALLKVLPFEKEKMSYARDLDFTTISPFKDILKIAKHPAFHGNRANLENPGDFCISLTKSYFGKLALTYLKPVSDSKFIHNSILIDWDASGFRITVSADHESKETIQAPTFDEFVTALQKHPRFADKLLQPVTQDRRYSPYRA